MFIRDDEAIHRPPLLFVAFVDIFTYMVYTRFTCTNVDFYMITPYLRDAEGQV